MHSLHQLWPQNSYPLSKSSNKAGISAWRCAQTHWAIVSEKIQLSHCASQFTPTASTDATDMPHRRSNSEIYRRGAMLRNYAASSAILSKPNATRWVPSEIISMIYTRFAEIHGTTGTSKGILFPKAKSSWNSLSSTTIELEWFLFVYWHYYYIMPK